MMRLFWISCVAGIVAGGSVAQNLSDQSYAGNIDERVRMELPGNVHPLARAEFDDGAVEDNLRVDHLLVLLNRSAEHEAALERLINEQVTPSSKEFHHWLTPDEFGSRFGPEAGAMQAVRSWLETKGLRVNRTYAGGILDLSGTAGQVRNAFETTLHRYGVRGGVYLANDVNPTVPEALAPLVGGVTLNSFRRRPHRQSRQHFTQTYNGTTQFYLTPADFATIYNAWPMWVQGITGAGQTVVVLEDSDMLEADWQIFMTAFGIDSFGGTFASINPDCDDPGRNFDEIETADAESVSTFAPGSHVVVAACKSTFTTDGDITAALNLVNGKTTAVAFSDSYGACEAEITSSYESLINRTWQQAAAEGISVFVAAGDEGSDECDFGLRDSTKGISVDGTASSPYVVAVGGTDFSDVANGSAFSYWADANSKENGSALSYIPEIPWNGTCASNFLARFLGYPSGLIFCNSPEGESGFYHQVSNAGSGGPSQVFTKPAWQAGVVGIANDGRRDLPDVSLFASAGVYNQSIVNCMSDAQQGGTRCDYTNPQDTFFNSGGGTSDTAPLFAGIFALITQATGNRQGLPNPTLYALAAGEYGTPENPNLSNLSSCEAANGKEVGTGCIFYDITQDNNDVPCVPGTRNCYSGPGERSGVLSRSTSTEADAFPSTPGWDFTTGLGSVNVANLVHAWTSLQGRAPK